MDISAQMGYDQNLQMLNLKICKTTDLIICLHLKLLRNSICFLIYSNNFDAVYLFKLVGYIA